jgi:hypothetical protein
LSPDLGWGGHGGRREFLYSVENRYGKRGQVRLWVELLALMTPLHHHSSVPGHAHATIAMVAEVVAVGQ